MTVMDCCEATSCGNLAAWRFTAPGIELDLCDRHADELMDAQQARIPDEAPNVIVLYGAHTEWAANAHEAA